MNPHVTSIEVSKRMKELGFEQKSMFYWVTDDLTLTYLATEKQLPIIQARYNRVPHQSMAEDYGWRENIEVTSAYLASELGEVLPEGYKVYREYNKYKCIDYDNEICEEAKIMPDAMALMAVYLKEQKLI